MNPKSSAITPKSTKNPLSIEPKEKSISIKLNGTKLFCAYQPVKKQITYDLDRGLNDGEHTLDITIIDRVGNQTNRLIYFTCK